MSLGLFPNTSDPVPYLIDVPRYYRHSSHHGQVFIWQESGFPFLLPQLTLCRHPATAKRRFTRYADRTLRSLRLFCPLNTLQSPDQNGAGDVN